MLQGAVVDKTKQAQPPRARQVKGQAPRRASTRWVPAVLERLWQAASRRRQDRQAAKQSPHSPTPCCPPRVPVRSGRPSQTGWRSRTWPSPPATRLHEAAAAHCRWLLRWRSHVSPFPGRRSRRSRSRRGGRWSTLAWFQASNALSDGSRGTTGAHVTCAEPLRTGVSPPRLPPWRPRPSMEQNIGRASSWNAQARAPIRLPGRSTTLRVGARGPSSPPPHRNHPAGHRRRAHDTAPCDAASGRAAAAHGRKRERSLGHAH